MLRSGVNVAKLQREYMISPLDTMGQERATSVTLETLGRPAFRHKWTWVG
jgi:hypothetical protein